MEASPSYSDPVLTASLYCAGRLDEVLHQVVAPSWRAIRQLDRDAGAYLWTVRNAEGGEHLEVCLHGPESLAVPARALLQRAADAFFADDDCSLVWTRYRRSHVALGGGPFLDDDGYVGRITRCLAAGCERVLLLEPDATGKIPQRLRQVTLLAGLASGLAAPGFPADARPAYLAYHRDSLLRLPLARDSVEACAPRELLRLFDRQVEAMGPPVRALRRTARSEWMRDPAELEGVDAAWRRALANLLWYIRPLCDDSDYRIDPSAAEPWFVPLFKAFHGFANQLGFTLVDEAYAHHLLWSATDGETSRPAAPAGVGSALDRD